MKERGRTEDIFEQEWREAFDGAEQAPPRIVWSEINATIANEKAILYKKKSIYYRWAAAAIFLLATSIGLLQLASDGTMNLNTIASIDIDNPKLNEIIFEPISVTIEENSGFGKRIPPNRSNTNVSPNQGKESNNQSGLLFSIENDIDNQINQLGNEIALLEVSPKEPYLLVEEVELVDHFYRMPTYGYKSSKRGNSLDDKYWAGVDFGSGSFDPNFQSGSGGLIDNSLAFNSEAQFSALNTEALDANSPTVRENMQAGQALSFGFNLGMRVSKRWSVQSGFQYTKAQATNTTNVVVASTKLIDPIAVTSQIRNVSQVRSILQADQVVEYNYQDVELNNEFQFASIPIKAGYKIVDSRFSVELKAGMAANLYLGNKLSDPSNQLAEVTIGPGSNSPYKEVSFMGLAGLQFGYEFVNRFNLVVEPNYRRALDNMTKGSSEFISAPSGFGLQTGISYQFN